jgi:hypothetical protein
MCALHIFWLLFQTQEDGLYNTAVQLLILPSCCAQQAEVTAGGGGSKIMLQSFSQTGVLSQPGTCGCAHALAAAASSNSDTVACWFLQAGSPPAC